MNMTKKKLLIGSGAIVIVLLVLNYIGTYNLCDYFVVNGHRGGCPLSLANWMRAFFPFLPLFLFSFITFFLKEETFQAWWKFARIATPLSMFLIFLAPSYSHDFMFPIEKGTVAAGTSLLFALISIIILFSSHWKRREK